MTADSFYIVGGVYRMIRESEHFNYRGVKSTYFDIRNVAIDMGLYNEPIISNKTINEVTIRGRKDPYFIETEEEPKMLQLRFVFMKSWDDILIDEIVRWLNVDYYQPLFFSEDVDRVFYALPVDGVELIHNGLKQGYVTLNMRCSSSKSFSHKKTTPIYETYKESKPKTIEIVNLGHYSMFPEIWIEKVSEGDITIHNRSNGNAEFRFKNIDIGEKLFVDCKNEIITTSKERTYRYDDFNDNYLELIYGKNLLTISNNIKIRFRYQYIFS